jgi:tetratricopeptide (TPR) repeat protein
MLPLTDPTPIDRAATVLIALFLLAVPLAHSATLDDPFAMPKDLLAQAVAWILLALGVAAALRAGGAARSGAAGEGPGPTRTPTLLALAFLAAAGLSVLPAVNRGLALEGLLDLATGVALLWAVSRFVRRPEGAALVLRATLAGATLVAVGSLAQVFDPGLSLSLGGVSILPPTKGGATLADPGLLAQFLILALPAGLGAAALSGPIWRQIWGGCLGLVTAALVFAGRPEGWIAALATTFLLVAARVAQVGLGDRKWSRLAPELDGVSLRATLVAAIVMVAVVAVSRWPVEARGPKAAAPLQSVTLLAPTTGDPSADRSAGVRGSLALLRLHPLGVGPANWRHAFLEVAWTRVRPSPFTLNHQALHAGNDLLERTAETGLAGGALFALLLAALLAGSALAMARAPAPWDAAAYAACGTLLAALVTACLGSPFEEPSSALLVWVMAGLALAALERVPVVPVWLRFPSGAGGGRLLPPRRAAGTALAAAAALLAAGVPLAIHAARRVEAARLALAGQAAFYAGNYRAALLTLNRPPLRRSPEHLPSMLAASAALRLGVGDAAERGYGEVLRRSPWFISAYLGRAAARQGAGHYDLAQDDLEAALRIWPDNLEAHLALARLLAIRGMPDAALDEYRNVARMNDTVAEPYFGMGEIFQRRAQYDEAIEAFRVCLTKDPRYPRLQLALGDAFYAKGLVDMALRAYQAAAELDQKDIGARLKIANSYHALNRYCEAKEALEAARDLETDVARRSTILELIDKIDRDCVKEKKSGKPRPS